MCSGRISVAYFQVKRSEDGRGPYRWAHVVRDTQGGLRQGSIYRQLGDNLHKVEAQTLVGLCAREGFDLRRFRRGQSA